MTEPPSGAAPTVSTAPPPEVPARRRRLPGHLGPARTSTVVLVVAFLAIGLLYLFVRPDPPGSAPPEPVPTSRPTQTEPAPTSDPTPSTTTSPPSTGTPTTTSSPGEPTTGEPTTTPSGEETPPPETPLTSEPGTPGTGSTTPAPETPPG